MADKPLIVQSDLTLLLDVHAGRRGNFSNDLIGFAELIKSPEHVHTFAVSPISLWNAATAGISAAQVMQRLERWSRFSIPDSVAFFIKETSGRFGTVVLTSVADQSDTYLLSISKERAEREILARKHIAAMLHKTEGGYLVNAYSRGELKLQLIKLGYPVDDRIPLDKGEAVPMAFKSVSGRGVPFVLRDYQKMAADSVIGNGGPGSGYGVIVLPCGSGKTVVGMEVMVPHRTLILTNNWRRCINGSTSWPWGGIFPSNVGEYSGMRKIKPITVHLSVSDLAAGQRGEFPHMGILKERLGAHPVR